MLNFDDTEEFNLSEDVCHIEKRFCVFYMEVIKNFFDLAEDYIFFKENDIQFRERYTRKNAFTKKNADIFNQPDDLLLLCIQDTCLGVQKFYALLMDYVEYAKYLSKKTPFKLYFVLGNAIFTALGICSVLDQAVEQYGFSERSGTKQIQLIVTEKRENCLRFCHAILEKVNPCYKNVEINLELNEESSFRLSPELFVTLKEADIVVMARCLSQYHFLTVRTHFLKVILKRMKDLSTLFYLDEFHELYRGTLKQLISETDYLYEIKAKEVVYEPIEDPEDTFINLKFPFLFTTEFKQLSYLICIKCFGIDDNCSANGGVRDESSLPYYKQEIKRKISERLKKEKLIPPSLKTKYRRKCNKPNNQKSSSKLSLNASGNESAQKIGRKILSLPSNMSHDANTSPSTSKITTLSDNIECDISIRTKMLVFQKGTQCFFQSAEKNKPKTFKSYGLDGKTATTNMQIKHKHKVSEGENKPNTETIEPTKFSEKLIPTNSKNACIQDERNRLLELLVKSKVIQKKSITNQQNK